MTSRGCDIIIHRCLLSSSGSLRVDVSNPPQLHLRRQPCQLQVAARSQSSSIRFPSPHSAQHFVFSLPARCADTSVTSVTLPQLAETGSISPSITSQDGRARERGWIFRPVGRNEIRLLWAVLPSGSEHSFSQQILPTDRRRWTKHGSRSTSSLP